MDQNDDLGVKYRIDVYPTFKFYHQQKELTFTLGANEEKLTAASSKLHLA